MRAELHVADGGTEVTVYRDPYFKGLKVDLDTEGAEYMQSLDIESREELDNLITALTVVGAHVFPVEN